MRSACLAVLLFAVMCATLLLGPPPEATRAQNAARSETDVIVDRALSAGDGQRDQTAYVVEGLLWSYPVLDRLRLQFSRQRVESINGQDFDVITATDRTNGAEKDVWFRVSPDNLVPNQLGAGGKRFDPQIDRIVRAIMTSGDGRTPETAFVVGGHIQAEYQVLRIIGLRSTGMQALDEIRGCSFDVLSAQDTESGQARQVYFKLGNDTLDPGGPCVLGPANQPVPKP